MFIRIKLKNSDIIKNVEKIDSIFKSTASLALTAEDLAKGIDKTQPSIKIVFSEEVEGKKVIEIMFDLVEKRDEVFEKISIDLDAKLIGN